MKPSKLLLILTITLILGCGGKDREQGGGGGGPSKLSKDEADSLSTEHSKFESSLDPPISADTHYAAGQLAESRGDAQTAIQQYKAALEQDPKHQKALFSLGVMYTQMKMYPEAVEIWQRYIKTTNGNGEAWADLGFCYQLAGQFDQAEQAYRNGIAAPKGADASRVNYGLLLARLGREDEALEQLTKALKPAEAHYNLASVYEQMKKTELAKREYKKALEIDPNLRDAKARLSNLK